MDVRLPTPVENLEYLDKCYDTHIESVGICANKVIVDCYKNIKAVIRKGWANNTFSYSFVLSYI